MFQVSWEAGGRWRCHVTQSCENFVFILCDRRQLQYFELGKCYEQVDLDMDKKIISLFNNFFSSQCPTVVGYLGQIQYPGLITLGNTHSFTVCDQAQNPLFYSILLSTLTIIHILKGKIPINPPFYISYLSRCLHIFYLVAILDSSFSS